MRTGSALIVVLAAVECLVAVVSSSAKPITDADELFWHLGIPTGPSVVVGLALFLLAVALRAGKRAGRWMLTGILCLTALANAAAAVYPVPGEPVPDVAEALFPVAWAVLLWAFRPEFGGRVAPGAWRNAALTVVIGLGTAVTGGWVLAAGRTDVSRAAGPRLIWVVDRITGGTFELAPGTPATGWLPSALDLAGGGVLIVALTLILRSARIVGVATDGDELRLRSLIATHGGEDSLAWFATRRDKRVVFAPSGRAAVAYRVVGGSSIAAGDPIGLVDDWPRAVEAWLAEARCFGWQPVVLAAGERSAAIYRQNGLRVRRMGDEVVVDTANLLRTGGRAGRVRRAVRRLTSEGYHTRIRRIRDVPPAELVGVAELADRWRSGPVERGFSMASGRTADPTDLDTLLVEATAPDGEACGLLTFAPWGPDGLSLDVMRRSPTAPPGLVEFMIGELVATGAARGIRRLSLNFVMFRETLECGSRLGAGPVDRGWHAALRFASSFAQIESLYHFSLTFEPTWTPRLLCWSGSSLRAAVAAGAAEGFLPVPTIGGAAGPARSVESDFLRRVKDLDALVVPEATTRPAEARALGRDPYPSLTTEVCDIAALRRRHAELDRDARTGETVAVTGRIRACRTFGSLAFATLRAGSAQIQVIVEAATAGAASLTAWKTTVGVGDLVVVTGEIATSRSGELSVLVANWTLAAVSMRPGGCDALSEAAERVLVAAGYAPTPLPPWHPALPGGFGPGLDGAPERLFYIDRSGCDGAGPIVHVRASLADALTMRDLLYHLDSALPAPESGPDRRAIVATIENALPWVLVPFARPRQDDQETADAWRIGAEGHEIASATTGLTDPSLLRRVQGSDDMIVLFEDGLLPFATLRVDLAALARSTLPPIEQVERRSPG